MLIMKKCVVLKEMLGSQNDQKFSELRVRKRQQKKYFPECGTIKGHVDCYEYNFKAFSEQVLR